MDLRETSEERAFRASIKSWLAEQVPLLWNGDGRREPPELFHRFTFRRKWHRKMHQGGWIGLDWPREYGGRGLSLVEQLIVNEEIAKAEAPPIANWVGVEIVGPTLIKWGSDAQKRAYLPGILSGDDVWCQAWSEPGAGSDGAIANDEVAPDTRSRANLEHQRLAFDVSSAIRIGLDLSFQKLGESPEQELELEHADAPRDLDRRTGSLRVHAVTRSETARHAPESAVDTGTARRDRSPGR